MSASAVAVTAAVAFVVVLLTSPVTPPPVVPIDDGAHLGTERSTGQEDAPKVSPVEGSTTNPGRPEEALQPTSHEEQSRNPQAPIGQGVVPSPVERSASPVENNAPDETKRKIEKTSKEAGTAGEMKGGEGSPSAPDPEAGLKGNESPGETMPPESAIPSPSGERSEGEGTVVEDDTSQQTTPTPPQATEPRLIQPAVEPEYPAMARRLSIQGAVTVRVVISRQGDVTDCWVVKSINPALDEAAIKAVRQWKFKPSRLNGVEVPAEITVKVRFELTS